MANMPDMSFYIRATDGSLERLNSAISTARSRAAALDLAVRDINNALEDVAFIVERSKPEEDANPQDAGKEI